MLLPVASGFKWIVLADTAFEAALDAAAAAEEDADDILLLLYVDVVKY
jgi:hypothetical protein